jgi:transposase-like protein
MRYSATFRNNVLKKVIPPESRSVIEVSKETGVSAQTIYGWMKQAKEGNLEERKDRMRPGDRSLSEKLTLIMESKGKTPEEQGEWLWGASHGARTSMGTGAKRRGE